MPQRRNSLSSIAASAFLLSFAMFASIFCVPPVEYIIRQELLLDHAQVSLLFAVPFIMLVVLAIPAGFLGDKIGTRKAAGIGAILLVMGGILRGTATDFPTLVAFTFVFGTGFGLVFPNLPKLVSAWVPREKAGIATGIFVAGLLTGGSLSLAITMPVIFPVTGTFQGIFYIWGIPALVATILWWAMVKDPPHISSSDQPKSQAKAPLYQLVRNKDLWLVAILLLLNNYFFFAWLGWTPALMIQKGAAPDLAALITSITTWVAIPSVLILPWLSRKLGLRKPFIWIPSIVHAIAVYGVIFMGVSACWWLAALIGISQGIRFVTIMALPVEMIPKESVGAAGGMILSIGFIGGIIGPLITGHLLDLTGSLDLSFFILIAVSIATAGITFKVPETGTKGR